MTQEISYGVRKVKPSKSLRIYLFKGGFLEPMLSVVRKGKRKCYKICHHAAQELIAIGIPYTVKTTRGKIWR